MAVNIAANLESVYARVAAASRRAGRHPDDVRVVVVAKGRSPAEISGAFAAGQRDFGENRAQELVEKAGLVPAGIRWHFVGPLQRNKVRRVRGLVVMLHSLDRLSLGEAWLKGPGSAPPALLQVNVGAEAQKHGVAWQDAEAVAADLVQLGIDLRGVMGIPPLSADPEEARPFFVRLRELRDRLRARLPQVVEISAGMTDDFEVAVEEGATIVRPGRAIFVANEQG